MGVKIVSDTENAEVCNNCEPPNKKRKLNENTADNQGIDSDLTLKVSSLILKAASPVFDQMLSSEMKESEERKIVVHAKSMKDVRDLVYFMCTGELRKNANPLQLLPL